MARLEGGFPLASRGVVGLRPQPKPPLGRLKTLGRFVCVGAPRPIFLPLGRLQILVIRQDAGCMTDTSRFASSYLPHKLYKVAISIYTEQIAALQHSNRASGYQWAWRIKW